MSDLLATACEACAGNLSHGQTDVMVDTLQPFDIVLNDGNITSLSPRHREICTQVMRLTAVIWMNGVKNPHERNVFLMNKVG